MIKISSLKSALASSNTLVLLMNTSLRTTSELDQKSAIDPNQVYKSQATSTVVVQMPFSCRIFLAMYSPNLWPELHPTEGSKHMPMPYRVLDVARHDAGVGAA